MSVFKVDYCKKGKPTSTRKFRFSGEAATYEEVLFDPTLNILCQSIYKVDYWYAYLNEVIFINRISANAKQCIYDVKLYDMQDRSKLIADYEVTIECMYNDEQTDIFEQDQELVKVQERKIPKPRKEKRLTEWLRKEKTPIKLFLIRLDQLKSLKKLKEELPKASYHRKLKICQEKGYIQGNKLAKRIYVSKTIK